MRAIAGIIIIGLLAWCGWWFVGSGAQKEAWETWFEDRRAEGWVAENSAVDLRGFPNRFDTTIEDLQLADPRSGWAWSAPFFQVFMLSYKPNHIITVWPDTQVISSPSETINVTNDQMRGSVVFEPGIDLVLDSSQIEISALTLAASEWSAQLESANFATRRVPAGNAPDFAHQIGLDAKNLTLSDQLKAQLDPAGILPATIDQARLDITAAFDAPWDRHSVEGRKPNPTAISIKTVHVTWGELNLRANGQLKVDAQGYPDGALKIEARNWQEILNLAASSGLISRDLAETVKGGLQMLSALGGDGSTLNVPLQFGGGLIRLGPIPIGSAPRLVFN